MQSDGERRRLPAVITLGIETSCDDTGLGLYDDTRGLLGHVLASQVEIHARHGGVVPELASRDHVRKVLPLLDELFRTTGVRAKDLSGIAVTAGPGLVGALMVGVLTARGLGWAWGLPVVGIHHMEAHLLAPLLFDDENLQPPFVALLVSGGHTLLVRVNALGRYVPLGESVDDAAGEAFDKVAKLLGLGYPGGPAIAATARMGEAGRFRFSRPMTRQPGLDFSFSGLKTQVRDMLAGRRIDEQLRADVARAFEEAVVETLVIKSQRAMTATGLRDLIVAGGVGANRRLRSSLTEAAAAGGWRVGYPPVEFCTDNGAMVAFAGHLRLLDPEPHNEALVPRPRWELRELSSIRGVGSSTS